MINIKSKFLINLLAISIACITVLLVEVNGGGSNSKAATVLLIVGLMVGSRILKRSINHKHRGDRDY